MDKQEIITRKDAAEALCNSLYAEIQTLEAQTVQKNVELERARGGYNAYKEQLQVIEQHEADLDLDLDGDGTESLPDEVVNDILEEIETEENKLKEEE